MNRSLKLRKSGKTGHILLIFLIVLFGLLIILFSYYYINKLNKLNVSEEELTTGKTFELKSEQEASLVLDNKENLIKVLSLNGNSQEITFSVNGKEMNLLVGEDKKIDLDNNSSYDLDIKLVGISNNKVTLNVLKINEAISVEIIAAPCVEKWTCSEWDKCVNTAQTRTCTDANNCGTWNSKPTVKRDCNICTEDWSCDDWGECKDNVQTRNCEDLNKCDNSGGQIWNVNIRNCVKEDNLPNVDGEWNTLQELLSALHARDLGRINAISYKPLTQAQLDGGVGDAVYAIGSDLNKNEFVSVERDGKQSIIFTDTSASTVSIVYFVKNSDGKLLVVLIQVKSSSPDSDNDGRADEDETCTGNIYSHFPEKCIRTNPIQKDSDNDGWWDGTEVSAGTDPNDANNYPFKSNPSSEYACADSDGGDNILVKGTVTYTDAGKQEETVEDYCINEYTLEEYLCRTEEAAKLWGSILGKKVLAGGTACSLEDKICSDGACIDPSPQDYGTLNITANVDGAIVKIDWKQVGVTPLTVDAVIGIHNIQVYKNGCWSATLGNKLVERGQTTDVSGQVNC